MTIRVGINGFGRIGRQVYRAIRERYPDRTDVVDRKIMTHLLKYDTNYGRFRGEVRPTADGFVADGDDVQVLAERDPARLPWKQLGVEVVVESTGALMASTVAGRDSTASPERPVHTSGADGRLEIESMRRRAGLASALIAVAASLARADVSTSVSGSRLLVTGDDRRNVIEIDGAAEGVSVVGLEGTLVDGSSEAVSVPDVRRLRLTLGRRSDRVTIRRLRLAGTLDVHAGRGNDRVVLDDVRAGATLIRTYDGQDSVTNVGPSRFRRLTIDTGNGNDLVLLDSVWVPGELHVDTGADDDDVEIVASEVGDDVDVHLGDGDDDVLLDDVAFHEDAHLDGEDGDDDAFFYGYVWVGDTLDLDGFDEDRWWLPF